MPDLDQLKLKTADCKLNIHYSIFTIHYGEQCQSVVTFEPLAQTWHVRIW